MPHKQAKYDKIVLQKCHFVRFVLTVYCWTWGLLDLDILIETLLENAGFSFEVGINYR